MVICTFSPVCLAEFFFFFLLGFLLFLSLIFVNHLSLFISLSPFIFPNVLFLFCRFSYYFSFVFIFLFFLSFFFFLSVLFVFFSFISFFLFLLFFFVLIFPLIPFLLLLPTFFSTFSAYLHFFLFIQHPFLIPSPLPCLYSTLLLIQYNQFSFVSRYLTLL